MPLQSLVRPRNSLYEMQNEIKKQEAFRERRHIHVYTYIHVILSKVLQTKLNIPGIIRKLEKIGYCGLDPKPKDTNFNSSESER